MIVAGAWRASAASYCHWPICYGWRIPWKGVSFPFLHVCICVSSTDCGCNYRGRTCSDRDRLEEVECVVVTAAHNGNRLLNLSSAAIAKSFLPGHLQLFQLAACFVEAVNTYRQVNVAADFTRNLTEKQCSFWCVLVHWLGNVKWSARNLRC